ncbi:hypothetical protein, partial [Rhizobium vallis]|uniref:hypothetical protein n=1 Tax=Rhizobium vallis TaxID=634290 RepID=UPI001ABF5359
RATNRRRSSITEVSFHGINTSRQKAKSVTHVSGTKRHLSLRSGKERSGWFDPVQGEGGSVPLGRDIDFTSELNRFVYLKSLHRPD